MLGLWTGVFLSCLSPLFPILLFSNSASNLSQSWTFLFPSSMPAPSLRVRLCPYLFFCVLEQSYTVRDCCSSTTRARPESASSLSLAQDTQYRSGRGLKTKLWVTLRLPGAAWPCVCVPSSRATTRALCGTFYRTSVVMYNLRVLVQEVGQRDLRAILSLLMNTYVTGNKQPHFFGIFSPLLGLLVSLAY